MPFQIYIAVFILIVICVTKRTVKTEGLAEAVEVVNTVVDEFRARTANVPPLPSPKLQIGITSQ